MRLHSGQRSREQKREINQQGEIMVSLSNDLGVSSLKLEVPMAQSEQRNANEFSGTVGEVWMARVHRMLLKVRVLPRLASRLLMTHLDDGPSYATRS